MKVVLVAGGPGSRLSEENQSRPKPMVEIGGHPILWHIMKMYWSRGFREFIICPDHRGYFIKEYFANHVLHRSDVTIDPQLMRSSMPIAAAALTRDACRYRQLNANRRTPQVHRACSPMPSLSA